MNKSITCDECGGKVIEKDIPYKFHGVNVGNFNAEVCEKCREVCFSEEESRKITEKVKNFPK